MLELIVDTTNPTPPYEQLRRQLASLITGGALPPGERLPPLRQLAGDLGLAVGTVARTYRELETAGLITSRRGGGTRVAAPAGWTRPAADGPAAAGTSSSSGELRWVAETPALQGSGRSPSSPGPADLPSEPLRAAAETYVREARALGTAAPDIVAAVRSALELEPSPHSS